ncbi:hypothetical protein L7F22_026436 [Adiantum nelumboides]|nr:hypothetical protein [Adiantum nelumboides]
MEDLEDIEQYGGIFNEAEENRPIDPGYVGGVVLQQLFLTRRRLEYDPLGIGENIPRQPIIPGSSLSSSSTGRLSPNPQRNMAAAARADLRV